MDRFGYAKMQLRDLEADIVVIETHAIHVAPVIDPVGAVVCAADVSNVKTVLVDIRIVKQDFRLVADLDRPRRLVEESRDLPGRPLRRA